MPRARQSIEASGKWKRIITAILLNVEIQISAVPFYVVYVKYTFALSMISEFHVGKHDEVTTVTLLSNENE